MNRREFFIKAAIAAVSAPALIKAMGEEPKVIKTRPGYMVIAELPATTHSMVLHGDYLFYLDSVHPTSVFYTYARGLARTQT